MRSSQLCNIRCEVCSTYVVDGLVREVLGGDHFPYNLLQDFFSEKLRGYGLGMLRTDNDGVDSEGDDSTVVVLVLNGDLSLGIRSEPWERTVASGGRHFSIQLVCELEGEGEQLWGLVGSVTKHYTLVTGTELLQFFIVVETLGNICGLLFNGNQDVASFVIKALCRIIVTNVLDGTTDDLLVVESGLGCYFPLSHVNPQYCGKHSDRAFTENHDHSTAFFLSIADINGGRMYTDVFVAVSQATLEMGSALVSTRRLGRAHDSTYLLRDRRRGWHQRPDQRSTIELAVFSLHGTEQSHCVYLVGVTFTNTL